MVRSGAKRGHVSPLLSECQQKYLKLLLSMLLQSTMSYTQLGIHSFKIFLNEVRRSLKKVHKTVYGVWHKEAFERQMRNSFLMLLMLFSRLRNTLKEPLRFVST